MFFLFCFLACQEEKSDFSFSVSSGSSQGEEPSSEEVEEEIVSEPEDVAEPETNQEPSSSEEDDCALPEESFDLPPQDLDGRVDCGEEIYINYCANCHGGQGQGTSNGQGLIGHIQGHSDVQLIQSIVYGEGTMPPMNLENQEVADVVAYMREYF
jgi:hypothetical protein